MIGGSFRAVVALPLQSKRRCQSTGGTRYERKLKSLPPECVNKESRRAVSDTGPNIYKVKYLSYSLNCVRSRFLICARVKPVNKLH